MASTSAGAASATFNNLSKETKQELFESGAFSNITLYLSSIHAFKVHTDALTSQSQYFAENCSPSNPAFTLDDSIYDAPLFNTNHHVCKIKSSAAKECTEAKAINEMLRFCYTGSYNEPTGRSYPPVRCPVDAGYFNTCMFHVHMNALGIKYGIDGLVTLSAARFSKTVKILRKLSMESVVLMIEHVYRKVEASMSRQLREAVRNEARKNVLVVRSWLHRRMGRALGDLSEMKGYEEEMVTGGDGKEKDGTRPTCVRCAAPFRSNPQPPDPRICASCQTAPIYNISVTCIPYISQTGLQITIWQCQGCYLVWQTEGLKRKDKILERCPGCRPSYIPSASQKAKDIHWKCSSCLRLWTARGEAICEGLKMMGCICCPERIQTAVDH